MTSLLRIKRSEVSGNPNSLAAGELAYSGLPDNGSNGGDRLYIGMGSETANNAVNHIVIGGKYYTSLIDAGGVGGTLTVFQKSVPVLSSTGTIDQWLVGNLSLSSNTLASTSVGGNIYVTPNGTGKSVVANLYVDETTPLNTRIKSVVGDTLNAGTGVTIVSSGTPNTTTISLSNTGVVSGIYGSSSAIPVISVNSQGQITSITSSAIATTLNISADSGADSIDLLSDSIYFGGGAGLVSTITNNTVTFEIDSSVATTSSIQTLTNKTLSGTQNTFANIPNSALQSPSITIGSTELQLGQSTTSLTGLDNITVSNLLLSDTTLASTTGTLSLYSTSGAIDVGNARITGVGSPVNGGDAATKAYVDNLSSGLTYKAAVNLKASSNISLIGPNGALSIDGHALNSTNNGYRLLLTAQIDPSENGIYIYNDNGVNYLLFRAPDADTYQDLIGASVFVMEGSTYANTGWLQSNHYITDFNSQNWVQFAGSGAYSAGNGLTLSGTTFNVNGTPGRIQVTSDAIDIDATWPGQLSINTVGTIATGTWNASIISPAYGGTGINNGTNTISLQSNLVVQGSGSEVILNNLGYTNITLPTSGTLATLSGSETLSYKTIQSSSFSGTTITASGHSAFTDPTDALSSTIASVIFSGGVAITKSLLLGTDLRGSGASVSSITDFNIDGGTY